MRLLSPLCKKVANNAAHKEQLPKDVAEVLDLLHAYSDDSGSEESGSEESDEPEEP